MNASTAPETHAARGRPAWLLAIVLLAVLAYLQGLDGRYIPKNGDESVYIHIARLTAESGRWLPLQSDLDNMRNTKPPLLTWQGIASTGRGEHWDRWHLRWPAVAYTFATALAVFALARRLSGRTGTGLVAALALLAYFSTFRYGRPFLTNAPETFWMFAPFWVLAYWQSPAFASRWRLPAVFGLLFGVAFLYKSFALALPAAVGLGWWRWHARHYRVGEFLRRDMPGMVVTMAIAVGLFALWFALDPDPAAIWREFVIGENAEKFEASGGYLKTLLWGGSSLWSLALNYPLNTGLLVAPAAAVFVIGVRRWRVAAPPEQWLWLWIATLFLVFALPSQRSGRYLFAAMPALAVLMALHWERIPRGLFALSLLLCGAATGLFTYLSWRLDAALPAAAGFGAGHWLLIAATLLVIATGLVMRVATRDATLAAIFLVYLTFGSTAGLLEGPLGQFDEAARRYAAGRDVWVACNFRASYEADRFLLPGANVLGYQDDGEHDATALARRFRLFTVKVSLDGQACAGCRVIGERLEVRSRHTREQIDEMLGGRVFENLIVRELLVDARPAEPVPTTLTPGIRSECR